MQDSTASDNSADTGGFIAYRPSSSSTAAAGAPANTGSAPSSTASAAAPAGSAGPAQVELNWTFSRSLIANNKAAAVDGGAFLMVGASSC